MTILKTVENVIEGERVFKSAKERVKNATPPRE
jgi:hypothetical protein